jgi:glycosyltransferase involved in cell wall biosynthesis
LPGYLSSEDLPMWYNAAQVFAYPSVYEGFGLPLVEAMACGTPVIASDTTSLPEAVGANGILVPPMDVDAWTEALRHLLDDAGARTDLARRGPLHAQQFTWMETARQTAGSYRRALNTRGENAS